MKKKFLFLLLLILLFAAFIGYRFIVMDKQNTFGRIQVISTPPTSIFIEDQIVGQTPYEDKHKTGEFLIKLIPQGTASGAATWQGKVTIYKNALSYVNFELGKTDVETAGEIFTTTKMDKGSDRGQIYVETEPTGALVSLDNDEKGVAPLILDNVPGGDHELSVFMPGFFRRTKKINVDPGYKVNAWFKLGIDVNNQNNKKDTTQKAASGSASTKQKTAQLTPISDKLTIVINETPIGYLRVREKPSIAASESAQVKPGTSFSVIDQESGWYKIEYEKGKEGWVSGEYTTKQ